jgi:hypothetical protein
LQKASVQTLEEPATTQVKEETAHNLRAREVGAPTTLGTLACSPRERRMMVIHLDRLAPYQGTAWNEQP